MKKTLIFLMTVLLAAMLIVSCNDSSKKAYKVTFVSGEETYAVKDVKEGEKVAKPADPTKIGYEFVNWTTDEAGKVEYDFESAVNADITLYAQWKDKFYTVTFDSKEGSVVAPIKVREGEKVTKPQDPEKDDNAFKYWTLNDTDEFDFNTAITGDITLKAFWLPIVSNVGDTVTLGKEPWKVLALEAANKRALLISEYLLGTYAYDYTLESYAGSEIREYLQSDEFFKEYKLSKSYMLKVDVTTAIETTTISDSGEDYLFLLSMTEAGNTNYFANDAARNKSLSWWLRSDAKLPNAYYVNTEGAIKDDRNRENDNTYVRPAFWYSWN